MSSTLHLLGGNGFLARHTVEILFQHNIKMNIISRDQVDLSDSGAIKYLQGNIKPGDSLIFFAAKAPCKSSKDFFENIEMARNVATALKNIKLNQFRYISSDAVYTNNADRISENSQIGPDNLHGLMHLAREEIFKEEIDCRVFGIYRPTLIFGPGDPHNSYGPNRFIREALSGEDIKVVGNGEECRDHIYVKDVAKLIYMAYKSEHNGVLNLCSGNEMTFLEIAEKSQKLKKECKINFIQRNGKMPHNGYRVFDVSLIHRLFPQFRFTSFHNYVDGTLFLEVSQP